MANNTEGPLHVSNIVATHQTPPKHHKKKTAPAMPAAPSKNPAFGSPAWRAKYNLGKK